MNLWITVYYLIVNMVSFVLYGVDKWKAKSGRWRIPEKTLFGVAFLGGGLGALLGMEVFRHKTRHLSFRIVIPMAILLHIVWMVYVIQNGYLGG